MSAMTTKEAGVVDVVLSNFARGYRNQELIAQRVAPVVNIPARNVRMLKFGKDSFRKYNTRRAPGTPVLALQYGYASDPISLPQDALQALVPDEVQDESRRVPGIDLAQGAVQMVMDVLDLGHEIETAGILRNSNAYDAGSKATLSGTDQWTNPSSDPKAMIKEAKAIVRRLIGRDPNKLTLGSDVFDALTDHPAIKDQFKYTSAQSITAQMLAQYLGLEEIIVGKAIYLPDGVPETAEATDIWGNDAILHYTTRNAAPTFMEPSFAYTYRLAGMPSVMSPRYDADIMSWKYAMKIERRPYLLGADAGFIFKAAVPAQG